MKAKVSPLHIQDFELLEFNYKFIVPEQTEIDNVKELFQSYEIDIDFAHRDLNESTFQVMCKVEVNNLKKPQPGYAVFAEGLGVFELDNKVSLDNSTKGNLKFYSSLNMMINNLRNIIYQNTNIGPMGGYLLPPIDIVNLFDQKRKSQEKKKK